MRRAKTAVRSARVKGRNWVRAMLAQPFLARIRMPYLVAPFYSSEGRRDPVGARRALL